MREESWGVGGEMRERKGRSEGGNPKRFNYDALKDCFALQL